MKERHTWNHIPGIHGVLVFDEAESIHYLDFDNLASAMGGEVAFDIRLGG